MYEHVYYRKKMYEHVYYRKKDVYRSTSIIRARLKRCTSTSIIVEKMYEHVYYRKKDVRARLLS